MFSFINGLIGSGENRPEPDYKTHPHIYRYKQLRNRKICVLQITGKNNEERNVVDRNYAKYRTEEALVCKIFSMDDESRESKIGYSTYSWNFTYTVGSLVTTEYEDNPDEVCGDGIHYYTTIDAAMCFHAAWMGNFDEFSDKILYGDDGQKVSYIDVMPKEDAESHLYQYKEILEKHGFALPQISNNVRYRSSIVYQESFETYPVDVKLDTLLFIFEQEKSSKDIPKLQTLEPIEFIEECYQNSELVRINFGTERSKDFCLKITMYGYRDDLSFIYRRKPVPPPEKPLNMKFDVNKAENIAEDIYI